MPMIALLISKLFHNPIHQHRNHRGRFLCPSLSKHNLQSEHVPNRFHENEIKILTLAMLNWKRKMKI